MSVRQIWNGSLLHLFQEYQLFRYAPSFFQKANSNHASLPTSSAFTMFKNTLKADIWQPMAKGSISHRRASLLVTSFCLICSKQFKQPTRLLFVFCTTLPKFCRAYANLNPALDTLTRLVLSYTYIFYTPTSA